MDKVVRIPYILEAKDGSRTKHELEIIKSKTTLYDFLKQVRILHSIKKSLLIPNILGYNAANDLMKERRLKGRPLILSMMSQKDILEKHKYRGYYFEAHADATTQSFRITSQMNAEFPRTPLTEDKFKELSFLIFGNGSFNPLGLQTFSESWRQGFFFHPAQSPLSFGLVQRKVGPCGILAVMQGYILKHFLPKLHGIPLIERYNSSLFSFTF
jgi:hypothetical protein